MPNFRFHYHAADQVFDDNGDPIEGGGDHDHDTDYQPLDSDLTSIAALTTTSFGRGQLALADAAALGANHSHSQSYMVDDATGDQNLTTDTTYDAPGVSITPVAGTWLLLGCCGFSLTGTEQYSVAMVTDGSNTVLAEGNAMTRAGSPQSVPITPVVVVANGSTSYKVRGQLGATTNPKIKALGAGGQSLTRLVAIRLA